MRVLFIGEIVGKAGVFCIKTMLTDLKQEFSMDITIANGDGATGGFGIGKNHAIYLRKLGVDVLTGGDQIYFKKDMVEHVEKSYYMVRPANFPPGNPGKGWRYFNVGDQKVAVINMLGQSGYDRVHASNPFSYLPELAGRAKAVTPFVIVDFHAVTTAEKNTMFHHADGLVSAVIGTGTRVQTADAHIMPKGTAVITDAGRTGSQLSVAGLDPAIEIRKFETQIPERSADAWEDIELQGVVVDMDDTGKATAVEAISRISKEEPGDRESTSH